MANAALRFTSLTFAVPGAIVQLAGTYDLRSEQMDFRGELLTDASLADMTSGVKSVLARMAQPFFRRPGRRLQVPDPDLGLARQAVVRPRRQARVRPGIGTRLVERGQGTRTIGGRMDAIALLKEDHRRFKKLLGEGDETTERAVKTRKELLEKLVAELKAHEKIEEEIFYPALQQHEKVKEVVLEGYEEHHVADLIVAELRATDPRDERWGAKFSVLKENIEHHIEEEEGEMFKKARAILDKAQLMELGARMQAMKQRVRAA